MNVILDCTLCMIYIKIPLKQFKNRKGGLFLDNLKCFNCGSIYQTKDLEFE